MIRRSLLSKVIAMIGLLFLASKTLSALELPPLKGYQGQIPAPEFPSDLTWLNTATPYSIKGLRGKIVLLDFWTYCCINCMHVLPDLHQLEEKYKDELVILGVHSAKFSSEQASSKIRQAILRYKIHHPVLNDHDMSVWDLYGVQAWPTLVLIAPDGKIVGSVSGEGNFDALDQAIAGVAKQYSSQLKLGALENRLEASMVKATQLSFPGKLLADAKKDRLFVSDSNHNRIVIAKLDSGQLVETLGTGDAALRDGSFEQAAFHNPQGLALSDDGRFLYVADTDNHAIRRVDLEKKTIVTIAGDGFQMGSKKNTRPALKELNSPWDLLLHDGDLYVAMAGAHQIWRMQLASANIEPYIGDGNEDLKDGALMRAELAQTSGISSDGKEIYFSDPETSSIRQASFDPKGNVRTLVGKGLFDFGDSEGLAEEARYQHPLGINYSGGELYIADTYNNRLKVIDLATGRTHFFSGSGIEGYRDGNERDAQFDEPGGLWVAAGKLYVADTNNHAVRVVDLETRNVSTFKFVGLSGGN
jgi:DNA-binding beta-propeller fold protein YncE